MRNSSNLRRSYRRDGFLLIEVLLVVIILSVSLTVIIASLVTCLRGVSYIRDYTQAAWLLDNMLSEAMIRKDLTDDQGEFDPPYERFRYEIKIEDPTDDLIRALNALKEVSIEVAWTAGRNEKRVKTKLWIENPESNQMSK